MDRTKSRDNAFIFQQMEKPKTNKFLLFCSRFEDRLSR